LRVAGDADMAGGMSREPAACATMDELRAEVDRLDRALVALLARRAACIDRAVELKRAAGLPARIEARVAEVLGNAGAAAVAAGLDRGLVAGLWERIVEWSIAREERSLGQGADGR
jgi:isochorismate pyruvate lyase